MVAGLREVRRIFEQEAWKPYVDKELVRTDIDEDPSSDAYLEALVRKTAINVYHPVGTCKMGAADDPAAVVDPELRVRGIAGLRVADASVLPFVPSGNTHAPCVMVGEKAADMIRKAHQ